MIYSIDQNCHSLWDVGAKLQALAIAGRPACQYVEDVDVAFTSRGASPSLSLRRERYYRSGGADWGAALFYSEFLGRLPVEIRHWERFTGMKTNVLARRLGATVDELYEQYSPGDNWQLVGPSYVGDTDHHRTMGDLGADEVAEHLRQLIDLAETDVLERFPAEPSRRRSRQWFTAQRRQAQACLAQRPGNLGDLYARWLREQLGQSDIAVHKASTLMAATEGNGRLELLDLFVRHYEQAAGAYNQAVQETALGLRPLDADQGELPFYAIYSYQGHTVRTAVHLAGGSLRAGEMSFAVASGGRLPIEAMRRGGIIALAGKAVVLVGRVWVGRGAGALALPYRGSVYMPAAHRLVSLLRGGGLLAQPLAPVIRVRLRLLDRLRELDTPIRLPEHLAAYFDRREIPANLLGRRWSEIQQEARRRLEAFGDEQGRRQWQGQRFPQVLAEIEQMERRKRQVALAQPHSGEPADLWRRIKERKAFLLQQMLRQIAADYQAAELDYWDSRGAIWPWCVALGGQEFYHHVLKNAEIYEEHEQETGHTAPLRAADIAG